jgi:hypothetical protein
MALLVPLVLKVPLVRKEAKGLLALVGQRVFRVQLDLKALLELMALLGLLDPKALLA